MLMEELLLLGILLVLQVTTTYTTSSELIHVLQAIIAFSLCSGARCAATLLNEMKRRGKDCRYGVISMCIGKYFEIESAL